MTATASTATTDHQQAIAALTDRMFTAGTQALELNAIYLGQQLGLYRLLAERGPMTVDELADAAGVDHRYAREWLQAQAISGYVAIDSDDIGTAHATLAPGAREVLVDEQSPTYLASMAQCLVASSKVMPALVEAFRTGEGVPYSAYGTDAIDAQGAFNRYAFTNDLPNAWIPAIPTVAGKLARSQPTPRVADVGCGVGWSSVAIAKAFPDARVDGFDVDEASIGQARRHAQEEGLSGRVKFDVSDMSTVDSPGTYDVALLLECLHDMSDPDGVLRNVRASLKPDGEVIVMDERTDDTLVAPSDDLHQRFLAMVSVAWCLPQGRTSPTAHPVGTVMRASDLREVARAADFSTIEVLPIEHEMFRFYRLAA